jgi:hypothetical protein
VINAHIAETTLLTFVPPGGQWRRGAHGASVFPVCVRGRVSAWALLRRALFPARRHGHHKSKSCVFCVWCTCY